MIPRITFGVDGVGYRYMQTYTLTLNRSMAVTMALSLRAAPYVQIEITTICNYRCFYCAGRDMPQQHMPFSRFLGILDGLHPNTREISLQGEGEPTAHPQFRSMVEAVIGRGLIPYTITNASLIRDPPWFAASFPEIGISIDTLDPEQAEKIGRIRLSHALQGVEKLIDTMGAKRIVLHTVDFGQPVAPVIEWARQRGFGRHIVQPLQRKDDYVRSYKLPVNRSAAAYHGRCRFLEHELVTYYNLDGTELPCCFIKDTQGYVSADQLKAELANGRVPANCSGCREIQFNPSTRTGLHS